MTAVNHEGFDQEKETLELCLYIYGDTPKSRESMAQVEQIRKVHLAGRCRLECIDLSKDLERAERDQILATPTLMKTNPPRKRIVGSFGDAQKVLGALGLRDC